jgi:hypothetical protein
MSQDHKNDCLEKVLSKQPKKKKKKTFIENIRLSLIKGVKTNHFSMSVSKN